MSDIEKSSADIEAYEILSRELIIPQRIKIQLAIAAINLSLRVDRPLLSLSIDDILNNNVPGIISTEEAKPIRTHENEWYASGLNRLVLATFFLIDQLSLCKSEEDQAVLLASLPWSGYARIGGWTNGRHAVEGISAQQLEEIKPTAEFCYQVYCQLPEDKSLNLSEEFLYKANIPKYQIFAIAGISPVLAAARILKEKGGPVLTPEKQNMLESLPLSLHHGN